MDNQRALKLVASAAVVVMLMFPVMARAGFVASECDAILGNLVLNCGFETGDFTDGRKQFRRRIHPRPHGD
jgi:hypothetical protein